MQLISTRLSNSTIRCWHHMLLIPIPTNTVATIVHHDLEIPENLERGRARLRSSTAPLSRHTTTVALSGGRSTCYRLLLPRYCRECGSRFCAAKNVFDWILRACFFLGCKMDMSHRESKLRVNHWSSLLVNKKLALARRTHKNHRLHSRAWRHDCPIPMWMKLNL